MDPMTALSLAGNVVQFIEFGTRLLSTTKELYRSSTGSLTVHDEIELVTTDLSILVAKLKQNRTDEPDDFQKICDEAASVATEILTKLGTMKVKKEGKYRELKSFRAAVKQVWSHRELEKLEARLGRIQEAIKTRVLFSLGERLNVESLRMSARFDNIDQQTQNILTGLFESQQDTSKVLCERMADLTATIGQLFSRLEWMDQDDCREVRDRIIDRISAGRRRHSGEMEELSAAIEMFSVSDQTERRIRTTIQDQIIQSLSYPAMTNRYESLLEPHPETFEWAFHDPIEGHHSWSNLSTWLQSGHGIYWINGKAGSGKSTLMKHLFDDGRTKEYLRAWAGDHNLSFATFFFWNSGTVHQRSHAGCLRSLLFQVLKKYPWLVPSVFPRRWAVLYSETVRDCESHFSPPWSLTELKEAFRVLAQGQRISLKICFLVDGLDEFDGETEALAKFFKSIAASENIKACVSSRPWIVFEDAFKIYDSLRLQNLTFRDIEKYVSDKLSDSEALKRLASHQSQEANSLMREIVDKADGVFLWVKLVVQSLLNGIRNRDSLADLWKRLSLLPRELEPLYERLLELIEPLYLPWVSKAFQIVRINWRYTNINFAIQGYSKVKPLSLLGFSLAMATDVGIKEIEKWTWEQLPVLINYQDTVVQLTARCAGFLEVSPKFEEEPSQWGSCPIEYFHRTARDFLEKEKIWSKLLLWTAQTDFDPNVAMMRSCIMSLRIGDCPNLTKEFMFYARQAAKHTRSHRIQTALVDRLDDIRRTINRMSGIPEKDWTLDLISRPRYGYEFVTLLELCTLFGLRGYIKEKICQREGESSEEVATALLHYLLPGKTWSPLPCPDVVSLLLDLGANPNDEPVCASAWQNTLSYLTVYMDRLDSREATRRQDGVSEEDYSCEQDEFFGQSEDFDRYAPGRIYLQILQYLLAAGADPHAHVPDVDARATPLSIIKTYLLPKFPEEAGQLLGNLNTLLEAKKSSTRKRPRRENKRRNMDSGVKLKKPKLQESKDC
ncbi:hypothetical protein L207DRAFT_471340 [Hyaloscypha variabilis F]|uniref:Uncharacterized protein n=1 Tax=Hyaloscypha variabilis (strain UAMH 11265 / GT02V1 / F) TaxID=1149755 RepID=A0A2J6R0K1_HYAVF|nr:hypothetical protein L207DRAFT_471340 [Hyaloscypha variabilis F]